MDGNQWMINYDFIKWGSRTRGSVVDIMISHKRDCGHLVKSYERLNPMSKS